MTEYLVVDCYGEYRITPDDVMATAPRRADGWWDRRTVKGREAINKFLRNQRARAEAQ